MNTKTNSLKSTPSIGHLMSNQKQRGGALNSANGCSGHCYLTESDEYFVKLKTTFTVPNIPVDTSINYELYLWPGIQSAKGGVLQPVLAFHSTYPSWFLHTYAIAPKGSGTPH
ncbi:hypothetical protein COMNV_00852 [Commensalibacter sp. Nvir]|uniref:hypothetical protein n=1 Tax=Commensalibacter sp. Nvir TaxID=3069817 RepID=UPI002D262B8F|nr:hypothetical protein COMNV_00852 [Commensalibacter sp. Nvir]